MNEETEKKIDDFNEYMLKQTAITFSMEGLSKDLKIYLQKKISHNKITLTQLTFMISSIMEFGSRSLKDGVFEKGHPVYELLQHIIGEVKITNVALDIVIQGMLTKEALLLSDKDIPKGQND